MKSCYGQFRTLSQGTVLGVSPISLNFTSKLHHTHVFDPQTMPKILTVDSINPNVKTMEYAVRGPIVIRAVEIEKELVAKPGSHPFESVIKANIGDAHAMGQSPITFIRQVLACVIAPKLLESPDYPTDVKEHALEILKGCGGQSVGSYSQSTGIDLIRKHVAQFIEQRDGYSCDPENVLISGGASESIRNVLKLFIKNDNIGGKKTGIMIPIPQYPLYSASIEEFNLSQVGYYLDEKNNWGLNISELERSFNENKDKIDIKAIVIINPGNPTGQVLPKENIEAVIKFAYDHNLFIFADEVYQENVYSAYSKFYSFKEILMSLGGPYSDSQELASFYSCSKGYMGECGLRGGYVELVNMCPEVYKYFKKMISAKLCSTILGQVVMDCVVNPPKPTDPSYNLWLQEKTQILKSLKERAQLVRQAFGAIEGISLNEVQGAMYAFPRIDLPKKAIEEAKKQGVEPDYFYVKELLEATGVCVVPGSGFGQRPGTYHFRTTILPQPDTFNIMLEKKMLHGCGLHLNCQDSLIQPLLNDYYQFVMCYAYWKAGTYNDPATFDLFFRKNPFQGEFTVFAGLEDCLRFVENFHFSDSDMIFLRTVLPETTEPEFFDYLNSFDCKNLRISAIPEGTVVFPKMPLITVEGPLAVCQILETTFLNLVNYASLVATNAARFRHVAGDKIQLLEFGLRRAQGPNGGLSASKYCYIGGFDATSNVLAGKLFGIPVKGTQAHSFICSFSSASDLKHRFIKKCNSNEKVNLYELSKQKIDFLFEKVGGWGVSRNEISEGELTAFCAYAIAFPTQFLALIDTYDVLRSGVVNFCAVTLALNDLGYRSLGCRIDSGDLSYLSKELRLAFRRISETNPKELAWIANINIFASNDINEETIISLNEQQHEINSFGVGTHLVTCQKQPALGCVYKLVAISGLPKIKLSQEVAKVTIPGRKKFFRLYGKTGKCILDLMTLYDEKDPEPNKPFLCLHPFEESKRAQVISSKVERLQNVFWENGNIVEDLPSLANVKKHVNDSIKCLRKDHLRSLNPTPYKVSVSEALYQFLHKIWLQNAPIGQLE